MLNLETFGRAALEESAAQAARQIRAPRAVATLAETLRPEEPQ